MTNEKQKQFVNELIENVRCDIINSIKDERNIEAIKEWDGKELRQYIADVFSQVVIKGTMSRNRKREYNNTRLVNNLL